jgi:hypothetical protein
MTSNTASPQLYACALCEHKLYYKNVITVLNLYSIISTVQNLLITILVTNIQNKNCLISSGTILCQKSLLEWILSTCKSIFVKTTKSHQLTFSVAMHPWIW